MLLESRLEVFRERCVQFWVLPVVFAAGLFLKTGPEDVVCIASICCQVDGGGHAGSDQSAVGSDVSGVRL